MIKYICTRNGYKDETYVCDYPVMKCPGCPQPHIFDINTNAKEVEVCLDDLVKTSNEIEQMNKKHLLKTFCGVPVRVDKSLSGFDYYIVVSPKLKSLLEKGE